MEFNKINNNIYIKYNNFEVIIELGINEYFYLHKLQNLYQMSCLNNNCIIYLTKDELKRFPIEYVYIFKNGKIPSVKIKITDIFPEFLTDINKYTDDYYISYNKVNNSIEEIIVKKNNNTFIHGIILCSNNRRFIEIMTNRISINENFKLDGIYNVIYNEQDFYAEISFDKRIITCISENKLFIKNLSDEIIKYFKLKLI